MRSLYTRPQRESIYHPATIGDIPQEVLLKAFLPLDYGDLISASSACRGWRPVAQVILKYRMKILCRKRAAGLTRWICGVRLNSIVFGQLSFLQISALSIDVGMIRDNIILLKLVARIVSSTLSSLEIHVGRFRSSSCFQTLELFFARCLWLRNLRMNYAIFGEVPAAISQAIKDGFGRLNQLDFNDCGHYSSKASLSPALNYSDIR
jgi:hypothetical protein